MSTFQFQIMSDLHLETPKSRPTYDEFDVEPSCSCLVLLGDIGNASDHRLFGFLDRQLELFETVLFLMGNHEPDGLSLAEAKTLLCKFETTVNERPQSPDSKSGRFIFLDKTRFDCTDKLTVLGCTLFSAIAPTEESSVARFVSDFSYTNNWTVQSHNAAHKSDLQWLNHQDAELARNEPDRSTVIFTHHSPTSLKQANDPRHLQNASQVQSAFVTDLSKQNCWTSPRVKIWAFGHTHFNCESVDSRTAKRVSANQKGCSRAENPSFDQSKIVIVETGTRQDPRRLELVHKGRRTRIGREGCVVS